MQTGGKKRGFRRKHKCIICNEFLGSCNGHKFYPFHEMEIIV